MINKRILLSALLMSVSANFTMFIRSHALLAQNDLLQKDVAGVFSTFVELRYAVEAYLQYSAPDYTPSETIDQVEFTWISPITNVYKMHYGEPTKVSSVNTGDTFVVITANRVPVVRDLRDKSIAVVGYNKTDGPDSLGVVITRPNTPLYDFVKEQIAHQIY